eukprot:scaffold34_cov152-Skeletonema_marinoi.AAC.1
MNGAVLGMIAPLSSPAAKCLPPAGCDVKCAAAVLDLPLYVQRVHDHSIPSIAHAEAGLQPLAAMDCHCICQFHRHECSGAAPITSENEWCYWHMLSKSG